MERAITPEEHVSHIFNGEMPGEKVRMLEVDKATGKINLVDSGYQRVPIIEAIEHTIHLKKYAEEIQEAIDANMEKLAQALF
jgi:hypothetical protein